MSEDDDGSLDATIAILKIKRLLKEGEYTDLLELLEFHEKVKEIIEAL